MSNRTMLEINHDCYPRDTEVDSWVAGMLAYLRTGERALLPKGVTFFGMRHHSDPCPLGEPPHGWDNNKQRSPQ